MGNAFNLIDEKWLPCQMLDGKFEEFGLSGLLIRSTDIKTLISDFSMEKVAVVRLLLAILHRNFGPTSTKHWMEIWNAGRFDGDVLGKYFTRWKDRFNLFDEKYPFFQSINLDVETRPLNGFSFHLATYHLASGNNATLWDHHTSNENIVLSPAQAARLLVTAQSFAFGFRDFKDGPAARGVNFLLLGENLFQTLMMNMVRYDNENPIPILNSDSPAWERDNAFDPERTKPDGYLDYLTWQSRKIRLRPEDGKQTVCMVQVDNGLKLDVAGEPFTKNPMMRYERVEKPTGGISPFRPLKFQEGRAIWRDSASIMEVKSDITQPPAAISWMAECNVDYDRFYLNSIGISSDQGKVNFYLEELFTFPAIYLENEILIGYLKTCLEKAEQARNKLWGAINRLAEILLSPDADHEGGRKPDKVDKQKIIDHISAEDQYWSSLEIPFYQLLNNLPKNMEDAIDSWEKQLKRSAWDAFEFAADFIGLSPEALKARSLSEGFLGGGLKKIFVE